MKRSALFVSILALLACGTRTSLPTDTPGVADAASAADAEGLDASTIEDGAIDADAIVDASNEDSGTVEGNCFTPADCPQTDSGLQLVCCDARPDAGIEGICFEACD